MLRAGECSVEIPGMRLRFFCPSMFMVPPAFQLLGNGFTTVSADVASSPGSAPVQLIDLCSLWVPQSIGEQGLSPVSP